MGGAGGGAAGAGGRRLKEEDEQCKEGDPSSYLDLMAKKFRYKEGKKIFGCDIDSVTL
jgi:hypothetical protein